MKTVFAKLLLISLCVVGLGFSQETGQSYIEYEKARFLKTSENNNAKYLGVFGNNFWRVSDFRFNDASP